MRFATVARLFLALCVSIALASGAAAQLKILGAPNYTDIDLGDREAGKVYPLDIGVRNVNCEQPLDFRFTSKTHWLRLPADRIVRQVAAGQSGAIQATLDLTDVKPGQRQAFVDVDCENCGFFVFKNCRIDKQELRFLVNVNAAPAPAPVQAASVESEPPQIDYDDERIPKRLRKNAKAAYEDWQDKLKKKGPCEEQLAKLQAAAAAADEAAAKARDAADTAEQDARNARAQEEAAQKELKEANKESVAAQEALEKAEKALKDAQKSPASTQAERDEAKKARDDAKAAKEAADKRVADAEKAVGLYSPGQLADMDKDAEKKRAAANKAADSASAAAAAASGKQKECEKLQKEADDAKAAKDKAEQEAKDAIPPAASSKPTPKEIADQEAEVRKCSAKLGELLEAQRLALEAMAKLGALGDDYESDLETWAKAVDDVNDLFDKVPPGIPIVSDMVGTTQDALDAVRAIIGLAKGITGLGNTVHIPKSGNDVVNPEATQKMLLDNGWASSPAEAKRVYEQMKRYSETNSTEKMREDLEEARKQCKAEEDKLDKLEKAAKG